MTVTVKTDGTYTISLFRCGKNVTQDSVKKALEKAGVINGSAFAKEDTTWKNGFAVEINHKGKITLTPKK